MQTYTITTADAAGREFSDWYQAPRWLRQLLGTMPPGRVLDMGAAWGRNAMYLAERGFAVTAVEPDPMHVASLRTCATDRGLALEIAQASLADYETTTAFDLVLCLMVLTFLPDDQVEPAVRKLQQLTAPGGLNLISGHTTANPPGTRPHLFAPEELRQLYAGWEIERYDIGYSAWYFRPDEPEPVRVPRVLMLARKPH